MRDKRTHRNYARNSLNLTFLLRYTGPACSEVTNFIGKRPIYRSPRSHTISAPPRARRVYTERARMRMRLHSDSVHTDSNSRFSWIPELPPNARDRWRLVPNRFTISNFIPRQRGNKCRGSPPPFYPDSGYHARSACVGSASPYLRIWNFIVEDVYGSLFRTWWKGNAENTR